MNAHLQFAIGSERYQGRYELRFEQRLARCLDETREHFRTDLSNRRRFVYNEFPNEREEYIRVTEDRTTREQI